MIPINVEPVNFNVSQDLIQNMRKMFEGLNKYNDMAVNADLYLKSHNETPEGKKEVSIRVNMPGKDIFIAKEAGDFTSAAQELHDALRTALRKHKEMHKDRRQNVPGKDLF